MKLFSHTFRHNVVVLLPTAVFSLCVAHGCVSWQDIWLPHAGIAVSALGTWVALSLAVHLVVSIVGMVGFGSPRDQNYRNIARLRAEGWDQEKRLVLCFVSQGIQESVLRNSVERAISLCRQCGVRFEVEVVVDTRVPRDLSFIENTRAMVAVPSSFETEGGSRFKARSLCYAARHRAERLGSLEKTWVLHCDEDTILTEAAVAGIHQHLRELDSDAVCGAGEIKYNAAAPADIFSLMDCHRTGEDVGRFRLQFASCGAALFGAHGSFLLVPAELERQVGFDFGFRGSITEDIYFALRLRELQIPCRWIQGYVREQSPRDSKNFLRQRARWIHGLLNGCLDPSFSWDRRALLLVYLAMWRTTIVSGLVLTLLVLMSDESTRPVSLWALSMTVVGTNSLVGALRNIEEDLSFSYLRSVGLLALTVVLIPVVCLFESVAVVLGVLSRPRGFFVVEKILPIGRVEGSVA